jgi:acyl carrier protein
MPPGPDLDSRLRALLQQQFPSATIPAATSLAVGGFPEWDSLGHYNYLLLVEETFDVRFSMEEMAELKGLDQIAAAVASRGREGS